MKVGDLVQMVTGELAHKARRLAENRICILIDISSPLSRRVATVMTPEGEIERWPLDSHYEIRVINESR